MVNHPIVIGIASLIPGLGYLMLGKVRKAVYVWLALLCAALVYVFSPFDFLWEIAAITFLGIWFAQIVWASRDAALEKRIASGQVSPARETLGPASAPPLGLSRKEKQAFQMRETVKSQIGMGENLGPVVTVMDRAQASIYTRMFYLGVVDTGVVVVELSMGGKPKGVQRIERVKVTGVEFKKGMLTDRLRLHHSDQKKPTTFYSQRPFREQMQAFASAVGAWQGLSQ
jgi:hypothetical protein